MKAATPRRAARLAPESAKRLAPEVVMVDGWGVGVEVAYFEVVPTAVVVAGAVVLYTG
jgi:hypothetical protein